MGRYGQTAEIAARSLAQDITLAPRIAWHSAVSQVFPESKSSRDKACPRDTFLALCGLGVVESVAPGTYTKSITNKMYVDRALDALRSNPSLAGDEKHLWRIATDGVEKTPNHQMDVLLSLFRQGIIRSH